MNPRNASHIDIMARKILINNGKSEYLLNNAGSSKELEVKYTFVNLPYNNLLITGIRTLKEQHEFQSLLYNKNKDTIDILVTFDSLLNEKENWFNFLEIFNIENKKGDFQKNLVYKSDERNILKNNKSLFLTNNSWEVCLKKIYDCLNTL